MQVRRWSSWSHTMRALRITASYMPWLPVSRDNHWRLPEGTIRRRLPRGLELGYSSRSSTTATCFQPDTLWTLRPLRRPRRPSERPLRRDTRLVRTGGFSPSWDSKRNRRYWLTQLISQSIVLLSNKKKKKKKKIKKKKRRKEKSMDVQMSERLGKKIYFFSSKWRRGQEGFRYRTTTT